MNNDFKKFLRGCNDAERVAQELKSLVDLDLKSSDVEFIYQILQRTRISTSYNLAFVSNHTIDNLARYVEVFSAVRSLPIKVTVGRYGQHFQDVLDPSSPLLAESQDAIVISLSLRELAPLVFHEFASLTPQQRERELTLISDHVESWVDAARQRTDSLLFIANFTRPARRAAGLADLKESLGEQEFYATLNLQLARRFREDSRVYLLDFDHILAVAGKGRATNARMYFLAKMEWDESVLPGLANEIIHYVFAAKGVMRKCLVLDLDNTLWGGVIGEDGVDGIRIGKGDPESEAYLEFQYRIKSLKERGVILAACSKNDLEDVTEVFERRMDMALRADDFAMMCVNWKPKHENVLDIATTLRIGTDSMVFIDDNPVECELIRQMLPEVLTIQLPQEASSFPGVIDGIHQFEKLFVTSEDKGKVNQYRQTAQRKSDQQGQGGGLTAFLESLETVIVLEAADKRHFPRIHQLFTKTNQFNLTTKRYPLPEIETFSESPDWELAIADVRDRFGSLGIVALYLLDLRNNEVLIDSFVLSCRAMGREIETALANEIKRKHLIEGSASVLKAQFEPTAKNKPAARFYDNQGFSRLEVGEDGSVSYQLVRDDARIAECPGITIERIGA